MGVCYSGGTPQITIQTDKSKMQKTNATKAETPELNLSNMNNSEYKLDPEFEDMPEWEGERYKGYGIKRMKGYKCELKIDELNKKREKFWASKKNSKQWKTIHQACVYDYLKAEEYLSKNNIKTIDGCINRCKDADNNIYYIPNFCINDPFYELEILPPDETKHNFITITLMDSFNCKNYKVEVMENNKGIDIKKIFASKVNIDLNNYNVRLLFGGGLIKDDEFLYQHKIKNGHSIQVCVNQI